MSMNWMGTVFERDMDLIPAPLISEQGVDDNEPDMNNRRRIPSLPCSRSGSIASPMVVRGEYLTVPDFVFPQSRPQSPSSQSGVSSWTYSGSSDKGRRSLSTTSSIFDLSIEADQLDKSIKESNIRHLRKLVQIHHSKFPIQDNQSDKDNYEARSRRVSYISACSSHMSHDVDVFRSRSPVMTDRFFQRESVSTSFEIPWIFRCSLHVAIQHNVLEVLRVLLKSGIDPSEPSDNVVSFSPKRSMYRNPNGTRKYSCFSRSHSVQENEVPSFQQVASIIVSPYDESNHSCHAKSLLSRKENKLEKPLVKEAIDEHLLDLKLNVKLEDALHLPPIFLAAIEKNAVAIAWLLEYGASVNVQDSNGVTPLHITACKEYFDHKCALTLLRHGASVLVKNNLGVTPLDFCSDLQTYRKTIIDEILSGKRLSSPCELAELYGPVKQTSSSTSRFFKRRCSTEKKFKERHSKDVSSETEMRERVSTYSGGSGRSRIPSSVPSEDATENSIPTIV